MMELPNHPRAIPALRPGVPADASLAGPPAPASSPAGRPGPSESDSRATHSGPPSWAQGVDIDKPSVARVYDYLLGGSHNFAVDREMAKEVVGQMPDLPVILQANRAFLRRAVRFLVGAGIRQFLDIGSGIPTFGNVHEVAQGLAPDAKVAYVDIDPVAIAHSRALLAGNPLATAARGDLREPEKIVADPDVRELIDFDQPVAVLLVAILHFMSDTDGPYRSVAALREAMASGSYVAVSHASHEGQPDKIQQVGQVYARSRNPMTFRSRQEVARFFTGLDLVPPGLVYLPEWRPEENTSTHWRPERYTGFVGVGRKP